MGFKANQLKVQDKEVPSTEGTLPTSPKELKLSKTETELLLYTLKNSSFKGEMVEVLYILVGKLKNNLKQYE
jgi:hypothetical protein